jgi:hypothetical protein
VLNCIFRPIFRVIRFRVVAAGKTLVMTRVLITVTPRMYRQAIGLSIRRQRPGCEVRTAAPGDTESELATFRPHLLVHNDNDGLAAEVLAGVPWRVEMQYTDSMDAHVCTGGEVYATRYMSTEDLLRVVDMVSEIAKE